MRALLLLAACVLLTGCGASDKPAPVEPSPRRVGAPAVRVAWFGQFTPEEQQLCIDAWEFHYVRWHQLNPGRPILVNEVWFYRGRIDEALKLEGRATWPQQRIELWVGPHFACNWTIHELYHLAVGDPNHNDERWEGEWARQQLDSVLDLMNSRTQED